MPIRIALCDDNEAFRRMLRLLLSLEDDLEVVGEAADGLAAVDVVATHTPDILLLDVAMPVMDGIEALPRLVAAAPSMRIIMLSGFSSDAIRDKARAAGANSFVEKGTDLQAIVARIRSVAAEVAA